MTPLLVSWKRCRLRAARLFARIGSLRFDDTEETFVQGVQKILSMAQMPRESWMCMSGAIGCSGVGSGVDVYFNTKGQLERAKMMVWAAGVSFVRPKALPSRCLHRAFEATKEMIHRHCADSSGLQKYMDSNTINNDMAGCGRIVSAFAMFCSRFTRPE